ncbi:hypothetical protein APR41_13525 [Salegentibacter salinarum]|uniref:Phosphatidic acid phosphatase type 2/haloperoxidase domain-containing protein n=1 Tax=Salegentibacter salinarum TaxID=447422 RepID=A0A2N0U137_9FLAO|nr:hypothetical protein [Salegentibacter salinarum]PKD20689.1 hypothetical protein APR41_13525 [Salegentibacter salinarum]SKB82350.1 hypothetical protein SAMN05660903_02729 [Salegentibacter salinarum]
MKFLLNSASFIFHPLWIPLAGSVLYFLFTPRFFPPGVMQAKLLAIAILTVFIPIVFYFLLKNLGKAESIFLEDVRERRWPLLFFAILITMVLNQILNAYNYAALYYFFVGILFSTLLAFTLVMFRLKASLHIMALSGLIIFLIGVSLNFQLNLTYTISFLILALGITASSRIYYKAHTFSELLLGLFCGVTPQTLVLYFWL